MVITTKEINENINVNLGFLNRSELKKVLRNVLNNIDILRIENKKLKPSLQKLDYYLYDENINFINSLIDTKHNILLTLYSNSHS